MLSIYQKSKLRLISILVFCLFGCSYAYQKEEVIEYDLYTLTPKGTSVSEVNDILRKVFGDTNYVGHGEAEVNYGEWSTSGWYADKNAKPKNNNYFQTYKLGNELSIYMVLPTEIYATWYFNKQGKLTSIEVTKETDGL